jgi:hypothetical protein
MKKNEINSDGPTDKWIKCDYVCDMTQLDEEPITP